METKASNDPIKCEISIVKDGCRHPAWLLIPGEKMDYLNELYSQACAYALGSEITSISFIELPTERFGSINSLLETIKDNIDQDYDWSHIDKLAEDVSKEVENHPDSRNICVEFVWNCGGGDDNIFTDSFDGVIDGPATQKLIEALEEMAEDGDHFYDFTTYDPQDGHINDVGVEEIIDLVAQDSYPEVMEFFQALRSADMRFKLNALAGHTQKAPPSPKPKF